MQINRPSINHLASKQLQGPTKGEERPGNNPSLKGMPRPGSPFYPSGKANIQPGAATDVTNSSVLTRSQQIDIHGSVINPKPDPNSNPSHKRDFAYMKDFIRSNVGSDVFQSRLWMEAVSEGVIPLSEAGQTADNAYLRLPVPTSTRMAAAAA